MSAGAGTDDSLVELARQAICAPLTFFVEATRRLPNALEDGERQIEMARNMGRLALRAASAQRPAQSRPTPEAPQAPSGAVDDYDAMTAREIVELVRSADQATRLWIRERETAGRGRVTVLRALDRFADDSAT